ncbi:MAG: MmgE/PrpD family protein [Chloroflexi bacterium]|nr:MmgE/PrpD family protein [Chloroflexota bacterium]
MNEKEALEHPTRALARFVVEMKYDDLPSPVIREAKRLILDVVGNAMAGSVTEIGAIALKYVRLLGGRPDCTIIGAGEKTSVLSAAYANSRLGDALDATDMTLNFGHIGTPVVASALAFSELEGASGKDLIAAVALGFEVGARLSGSVAIPSLGSGAESSVLRNRMPFGALGAASAAGRVMGFDEERLMTAYSIAGANASLATTRWTEAAALPLTKYGDAGLQASDGGMGALMAGCGMTAYQGILDGENGLWKLRGTGACDFNVMVGGLGEKWYFPEIGYKPWPSVQRTRHALTLFTRIISENQIRAEEIESVLIRTNSVGASARFADKNPIGMVSCEFNQPHAIAMAALGVKRGADWYSPEIINDARVRALREKVDVGVEPRTKEKKTWPLEDQLRKEPTSILVAARGKTFEGYTEYAKGDPWTEETYFSDDDLRAKFRDLASSLSIASTSWRKRIEEIIDTIARLEQVEVADLVRLFSI